nr:EAL domain-containing protein [Lachnospiraceae bacterium]
MYEKSRMVTIGGSIVCWVAYCICILTNHMLGADVFSMLTAILASICIALAAVPKTKYRLAIVFISLGPLIWALGDLIYLFNDFGIVADDQVVAYSDPVYRIVTYVYVIGLMIFSYVQFTRKDILRLVANTLLFSVSTFIISVAFFEMFSHAKISFLTLRPAYFVGILLAMFIIVFFMVIIANRSSRKLSFYGLMVMLSFFLYGFLDIRYMMIEAIGGNAQSLVVDVLFSLSIVFLGLAYSASSIYRLIEKTEKEETKRSTKPGMIMAFVIVLVGLLIAAIGYLSLSRFFILMISALSYFLLSKTIEVNELNEKLIERQEIELTEANEKLANVSVLDIQTGLKNRRAWNRYMEDFLAQGQNRRLILYSIDVNFFKLLNNTYGTKGGDLVLEEIGRRLRGIEDAGISAYRMDGDQFLVACEDESHDVDAARFADYLLDMLDRSFDVNGKIVRITFRIGAAIYPDDTNEFENLMNCVESVRSTSSPNASTSTCAFFDAKIMPRIQREQVIRGKLQDLDYDGTLELHYQPQMNVASGEVFAVEALLRWKDEELGYISPNEFIPIAEKMGVMPSLGEWIIRQAFIQIQEWNTTYHKKLVMGINISAFQLQDEYFMDTMLGIMDAMDIPVDWIDLELTESVALNSIINSTDVMR